MKPIAAVSVKSVRRAHAHRPQLAEHLAKKGALAADLRAFSARWVGEPGDITVFGRRRRH